MAHNPKSTRVSPSLYRDLLGDAWDALPDAVRACHFQGWPLSLTGDLSITVGTTLAARVFQRLLRLPREDGVAPARLDITGHRYREVWGRRIGTWRLRTVQSAHRDALVEQVGPLEFRIRLEPFTDGLRYAQEGVALRLFRWRIRLPSWAAPYVTAFDVAAQPTGQCINVILEAPGGDLLIAYAGVVRPEE
jgi:hypothetical protein